MFYVCFCDMTKALDCINHKILIQKLKFWELQKILWTGLMSDISQITTVRHLVMIMF